MRPSTTIVGSFRPDIVAAPGYRTAGGPSRQDAPGSVRITIEEALILQSFPLYGFTDRPAMTCTGHGLATRHPTGVQNAYLEAIEGGAFRMREPWTAETAKKDTYDGVSLSRSYEGDAVNSTVDEYAEQQSFPQQFHVAGNKGKQFLQVGNAVPPLMVQRVLEAMWGMEPQVPVWSPPDER